MRLKGLLHKKANKIKDIFPEAIITLSDEFRGSLQDIYFPDDLQIVALYNHKMESLTLYPVDEVGLIVTEKKLELKEEEFVEFVIN